MTLFVVLFRAPFTKMHLEKRLRGWKKLVYVITTTRCSAFLFESVKGPRKRGVPEKEKDTLISVRTSQFKVLHHCFLSLFGCVRIYKCTQNGPFWPLTLPLSSSYCLSLFLFFLNCIKSEPISTLKVTLRHSRLLQGLCGNDFFWLLENWKKWK